ncbi:MAG TPA: hypothetical protein PK286_06565 [Devosia sp.]|nr:hypothetical protein [Devosia sp.]
MSLARIVLPLAAVLAMSLPAAAIETGTRAWLIHSQPVFDTYKPYRRAVGELDGQIRIRVDRCHKLWCEIHAKGNHGWVRGWVWQDNISFGREPKWPWYPNFY